MKKYKSYTEHTKEDIDLIKEYAPVKGTEYNQKCNRCGEILPYETYKCNRCGSYDIVDL